MLVDSNLKTGFVRSRTGWVIWNCPAELMNATKIRLDHLSREIRGIMLICVVEVDDHP